MDYRKLVLIAVTIIILLVAGCITGTPQGQNLTPLPIPPGNSIAVTETIPAHFPVSPLTLPEQDQFAAVMGSFDDTYIGSMDCSNGSETFETNYTYFSGAGSPLTVTYQLVPVTSVQNTDEGPLPAGILNASVEPDRFTAEPYHLYTSRVRVTVGPNVVGYSGPNFSENPSFSFYLKVEGNGEPEPGANDWVDVVKVCYLNPGMGVLMWTDPRFSLGNLGGISLSPGESVSVPVAIQDSGGGIREEYFRIGGMRNEPYDSFPFTDQDLRSNLTGVQVSVTPARVIGRSFTSYNVTFTVTAAPDVPTGTYHFPLELCYRNLASPDSRTGQDPFENQSACDTGTDLPVTIAWGSGL
jgi:hypothetical protein